MGVNLFQYKTLPLSLSPHILVSLVCAGGTHGAVFLKVLNLRNVICFYLKVLGMKTLGIFGIFRKNMYFCNRFNYLRINKTS